MVNRQFSLALLLIPTLAVLSSCSWFGGSNSYQPSESAQSGPAFVTVNGKTAVTVDEFKETFEQLKHQQALDQSFDSMPAKDKQTICSRVAESLLEGAVIEAYVREKGWDTTPEFAKEMNKVMRDVERQLRIREFVNRMLVELAPSDEEAADYYEKNKESNFNFRRPPFISQPDGVMTHAVKVANEAAAKDLLVKAKKLGSLKKAASEIKANLEDLGAVSPWASNVDFMVVQKVLGMKDVPGFDYTATADKKGFYVVHGVSRTEPAFVPFENVVKEVKDIIAAERFSVQLQQKLATLKEEYQAAINEEAMQELIGLGACEVADFAPAIEE